MNSNTVSLPLNASEFLEKHEADFIKHRLRYARITIVRVNGTASSRPGDRFLATSDGELIGFTGGGCIRNAVSKVAQSVISSGVSQLAHAIPKAKADEPNTREDIHRFVNHCPSQGELEFFVEPILPKQRVALFGISFQADAISNLLNFSGFQPYGENAEDIEPTESHAGDFAVIATMGRGDRAAIEAALSLQFKAILFIASNKKANFIKEKLQAEWPTDRLDCIQSPAGIEIGAKSPEEIAISVVAQLIKLRSQKTSTRQVTREHQND